MGRKVTAKEAATVLGYHVNHVYRLCAEGTLKAEKFGQTWVIDLNDVEKLKLRQDDNGRLPARAR